MKVDCVGCGQYEHVVNRMPCGHDIAYYVPSGQGLMCDSCLTVILSEWPNQLPPCWCSCHRYYEDEK
jgi:hypothetical protein